MRYVEIGFAISVLALVVGLIVFGITSLMGWTFVHDKLRSERKEDRKEERIDGTKH